jgi:hypothetical protein
LLKDLENGKISQIFALAKRETRAALLRETKKMQKVLKRFGGLRKRFYLCTTFRLKKAGC